mmetsp:Transcript_35385/g.78556  ORF Transcript_35385/g.78556 Transcript_35385/m.78556 type:complete len:204 (+) Transcript_35385:167-778(+)
MVDEQMEAALTENNQEDKNLREVGHLAVWSVTSAKPGNGVELLRDGRTDTFWQSDGSQPHLINIQFQKKTFLSELHMYLDYKLDESYTPSKISIRAGTGCHDLKEIRLVELEEPSGWVVVPLRPAEAEGAVHPPGDSSAASNDPTQTLKAFFLQVAVLTNHQNGRDTHVREIRIYSPRTDPVKALGLPCSLNTQEFSIYTTLR